jgi:hypothetical protein
VIVTAAEEVTELVVAVKVAVAAPAATVTEDGTWAAAVFELVNVTTTPPVGATPLRVTVPVDEVPPTTEVGFTLTPLSATPPPGAVTVKDAVRLTPL